MYIRMYIALMVCFCSGIAAYDIKTYRIPDILLLLFASFIIILEGKQPFFIAIERIVTAFIIFLLFAAIWHYSRGLGFGDVKYAALLGYIMGADGIISTLLYAAFLSIFIYLIGFLAFHLPKTTKIPFAPFLSAGAILSLVEGIL